jgi:hypothetical protein
MPTTPESHKGQGYISKKFANNGRIEFQVDNNEKPNIWVFDSPFGRRGGLPMVVVFCYINPRN